MLYKALVTFCGTVSMAQGAIGEITDSALCADLLKAGYIVAVEEKHEEKKAATKVKNSTTKKR